MKTVAPKIISPKATQYYAGKPAHKTPVNVDSIEAMTPETDKMVTGIFKNIESPGQPGKVTMRLYKGQHPFSMVMEDGKTYTIPLSIARSINRDIKHQPHTWLLDAQGNHMKTDGVSVNRYQFISTDYQ